MEFPELERITPNPMIMGGKPCIRGMRITVGTIVGLVASDASFEEILQQPLGKSMSRSGRRSEHPLSQVEDILNV
jgi:uncharacterized protein DUF433